MDLNQNLAAAIEQATSETHKREFEVGGQMLTFPRLSIGEQGAFEAFIREDQRKRGDTSAPFSLSATRNKSAMAMSGMIRQAQSAVAQARTAAGEGGMIKTVEEAQVLAAKLQQETMDRFLPYTDRIFAGFRRDQMLEAVATSLRKEYGPNVSYSIEVDGKKEPITEPIGAQFVDKLFSSTGGHMLENVFLWVVGLSEQQAPKDLDLKPGMTLGEIAKEAVGDEENSGREQGSE